MALCIERLFYVLPRGGIGGAFFEEVPDTFHFSAVAFVIFCLVPGFEVPVKLWVTAPQAKYYCDRSDVGRVNGDVLWWLERFSVVL